MQTSPTIHREMLDSQNSQITFKKKNKVERLTLFKSLRQCGIGIRIDLEEDENPEVRTCIYGQSRSKPLHLTRCQKNSMGERIVFSTNDADAGKLNTHR